MTEETPGFDEKPDVPSGATPDNAEPQAATPSTEEAAAPAGVGNAAHMCGGS
ncbi:nucleotide exchange factor GrpE, partial [Streptomyces mirabilis]